MNENLVQAEIVKEQDFYQKDVQEKRSIIQHMSLWYRVEGKGGEGGRQG